MNGQLVYDQTSGDNWGVLPKVMLHEQMQSHLIPPPHEHASVFDDLEFQMAQQEAEHTDFVLEIAKCYVLPSDSSVIDFLKAHRVLPQLLIEAVPHLQKRFGNTVFALRATSDEYGWETLYVDARWPGNAADVLAAIDRFEDDWWIANSHVASGALNFTYRLI